MAYPETTLADLRSSDNAVRLKAARRFESEMRGGALKDKKTRFGNKKTTTVLIQLLDDPDPRIVHHAVVALAEIASKYYQDDRAYEPILKKATSKHPLTARWAIVGAINLRGEDSLDDVLPFCRNKSDELREMSLYWLYRWVLHTKAGKIRAANRTRLQQTAVRALKDASTEVRSNAAYLLGQLGDAKALAPLQASLKAEKNRMTKDSIKGAIEQLEKPKS